MGLFCAVAEGRSLPGVGLTPFVGGLMTFPCWGLSPHLEVSADIWKMIYRAQNHGIIEVGKAL